MYWILHANVKKLSMTNRIRKATWTYFVRAWNSQNSGDDECGGKFRIFRRVRAIEPDRLNRRRGEVDHGILCIFFFKSNRFLMEMTFDKIRKNLSFIFHFFFLRILPFILRSFIENKQLRQWLYRNSIHSSTSLNDSICVHIVSNPNRIFFILPIRILIFHFWFYFFVLLLSWVLFLGTHHWNCVVAILFSPPLCVLCYVYRLSKRNTCSSDRMTSVRPYATQWIHKNATNALVFVRRANAFEHSKRTHAHVGAHIERLHGKQVKMSQPEIFLSFCWACG